MLSPDDMRQQDFYSFNNQHKVLVVGAGSIGSYVAFGLARMGVKHITVVDFDTVARHNLPNQFFSEELLTEENTVLKTVALQRTISMVMPNVNINIVNSNIMDYLPSVSVRFNAIFVCVDDMNVRKQIWNFVKNGSIPKSLFLIDARVGGLYANIFSIEIKYSEDSDRKSVV